MGIKYEDKYRTRVNGKRTYLYRCFYNMMARCYKPYNKDYASYGQRGIKVEPFLQKRKNFVDYMYELLPKGYTIEDARRLNMSIDRYPNENGNYERGNLRWATAKEQVANRNISKNNTSGYQGVSWYKPKQNWRVQIHVLKTRHLGYFNSREDAFDVYQKAYLEAHGPEVHAKMMDRQRKRCEELGLKLKEYK